MSLTAPQAKSPRTTYDAVLGSPYVARLLGAPSPADSPTAWQP
ncbi:hypothetical protein ACIQNI_28940 [Streptomyces sp. NPDC091266]